MNVVRLTENASAARTVEADGFDRVKSFRISGKRRPLGIAATLRRRV